MSDIITLSIDVTRIDKAKIKPFTRRDGTPGKSVGLVLIPHTNDRGDDYLVVQETTQEERKAGVKGAVLGNGKIRRMDKPQPKREEKQPELTDDVPF